MSEEAKKVREKTADFHDTGFYNFVGWLARWVFPCFFGLKYVHQERVKEREAPYIMIGNHQQMADPVILAAAVTRYQLVFLAKEELLKNKLLAWAIRRLHAIPVARHSSDMGALRTCVKTLRDGHILGIFPEGTRHHKGCMEELESGTAMLALRSGVPLVPVLIPEKFRIFHRNWCIFGEDIPTQDLREKGISNETCQELNRRITETYRRMLEEYRTEIKKK